MDLIKKYLEEQQTKAIDTGWKKAQTDRKDEYGNRVKNVARRLARQGMQAAVKDLKKGPEAGKRQVEEVEELDEALRHKIAGAVGQFIGNKIDPVHGEIMRVHGEEAYRQAAYHIRKTLSGLHDTLKKHLSSGNLQTEGIEELEELKKSTLASYADKAEKDIKAKKDEFKAQGGQMRKKSQRALDTKISNRYKGLFSAQRKAGLPRGFEEEDDLISKYSKIGEAKYPGFRVRTTSGYPNLGPKLPRRGYGYVPQGLEDPRTGLPLGFSHPPKKDEPKKEEPSKKPNNS